MAPTSAYFRALPDGKVEYRLSSGNASPTFGIHGEDEDEQEYPPEPSNSYSEINGEESLPGTSGPAQPTAGDKDETSQDGTMKCVIKHLERRYNKTDEKYFSESKEEEPKKPTQKDWWRLYALCIIKTYNKKGECLDNYTRFYVNHQPLRQLLHDVIGNYPSDPIDVDDVQIQAPYHSLFHYRQQLRAEGLSRFDDDEGSLAQVKLLLSWIDENFEQEIAAYEKCVTRGLKAVIWDQLWILFPPGTIVYVEIFNQHRAFQAIECWYDDNKDTGEKPQFYLRTRYVDFDGKELGARNKTFSIKKYGGARDVCESGVMPFSLLEDADELREKLVKRGREFESYLGQKFVSYDGISLKYNMKSNDYQRFHVSGRVMIDCKTYHRFEPNDAFEVFPLSENWTPKKRKLYLRLKAPRTSPESKAKKFEKLSDENAMLTNSTVRGYSFTLKIFLEFFIDQISPIEWNMRCFEDLVIDPDVKKMIQALVSTHINKRSAFDDIVKGKGQGLVCVLHGPPGVGKTLTAECVAEYARRPLYMVSSGDLGVTSTELDAQLTRIMDLTSTWGAVLLIDEADVFLEQRALHDVHRNAMVSVCLRILEYHTGILFLTTNRVATFDEAFKSRIHIPVRYTDLSTESRKQIWRSFCDKARVAIAATSSSASAAEGDGNGEDDGGSGSGSSVVGVDIDDAGLDALAKHDLNGRQIKNIVKTAESLAIYDGVKLDLAQLQQVTKIQAAFDKDMSSLDGVDYTAPGAWRKDADSRGMFM